MTADAAAASPADGDRVAALLIGGGRSATDRSADGEDSGADVGDRVAGLPIGGGRLAGEVDKEIASGVKPLPAAAEGELATGLLASNGLSARLSASASAAIDKARFGGGPAGRSDAVESFAAEEAATGDD